MSSVELSPKHNQGGPQSLADDAVMGGRKSVTLLVSLAASWGIGFAGRLIVPRRLGPELFGAFQFADYFSATFFVISVLGFDTYIRKEVSVRREHASEFFGGLLVMRAFASAVALAAMLAVFAVSGKPAYIRQLLLIFAVNQVLSILNNSYATLLNAISSVGRLSVLNVVIKLVWVCMVVVVAVLGGGAAGFAWALALSESLRTIALIRIVRHELAMDVRLDIRATRAVLVASMPFWVVSLTGTLYLNADVTLMAFRASDIEVGWYGASLSLMGVMMFLAPIIHNVFLPMISRASARSAEELTVMSRRGLEVLVTLMTPVALFAALAADFVIRMLFGDRFAPAAGSLRLLAPVILLVYVSILPALVLTRLERGWTVTWVSTAVLVMNLVMNWFAIPYGQRKWGPGGAGVAAAGVWLLCEAFNVAVFFYLVSERFFDRRNLVVFAKTAGACAIVIVVHLMVPRSLSALLAEAGLYLGLIIGTRALRVSEVLDFAKQLSRSRQEPAGSSA
jgi:O-antigen/teichoic acid export membrane protein